MACSCLQRLRTLWWQRRMVDASMNLFLLSTSCLWLLSPGDSSGVLCFSRILRSSCLNRTIFVKCDEIQTAVCPLKLQWQWPLVLLKYSYIDRRNSVMVSIFECINHWKMFPFTFLMINLIARLITFFSYLFLWCYLKLIFLFIILVEFKMAASYFETCGFAD